MAKLKSTAVKIFPSAFRGLATGTKYNPEARLNTEFNITNLINRLASKDSFVISWNPTTKVIIFNIHGYYFENNLTEFLGTGGAGESLTNIYASIKIRPFTTNEANNTAYQAFTLVGTEDPFVTVQPSTGRILDVTDAGTDIFEGLDLHSTPVTPEPGIVYELLLLSRATTSDQWLVPVTSALKFKATDIEGLPTINNSTTANTTSTIFAAATAGTTGQLSVSQGGVLAPTWISTADVVVGEASQAVQLKTSRNLWGRPFNGTAAVSGNISSTGNITPSSNNASNIGASDNVYANVYATTFIGNLTGNADTVTNGVVTTGSYADPSWITSLSKSKVGLDNVTNNAQVTAVTATSPVSATAGTTPIISLASGYGDTQNPYASKTQKTFLAAPNAANGVPTFRAIVASDIPTLNQNTTGTATNATNTDFTNTAWSTANINGTVSFVTNATYQVYVDFNDDFGLQSNLINFGIFTYVPLFYNDNGFLVGVSGFPGTGNLHSLEILTSNGEIYFYSWSGTQLPFTRTRITSSAYKLKYRRIR